MYRPAIGADQLVAAADSLTMDSPTGIPAGNIVADVSGAAVPAQCGELLVVRTTLVSGQDIPDFEVRLTLP